MQALTKETAKIFWAHSKKYRWSLFFSILGMVVVPGLQTYVPLLYRNLINLLAAGPTEGVAQTAIRLVIFIVILNLCSSLFRRILNLFTNFFQPAVMRDLTNTCYQYLQRHSFGFFSSNFVGSLVTKVKRFEKAFEKLADQITYDLGNSIILTGAIIVTLLFQYPLFGWIVLGWSLVFLAFSYFFSLYKLPWDLKRAKSDSYVTGQLADGITNNINTKLFTNYEAEDQRFAGATQEQFKLRKKSWDLGTISDAIQAVMMVGLEFSLVYLGIRMWQQGLFLAGDLALLQVYLFRIFDKLWNTGKNIRNTYEAIADANEMTELLLKPHAVVDAPHAASLTVKKGAIEFIGTSFGYYNSLAVLDKFDLAIKPGERVALIGPSGGGKSTIVRLLFRFYDVDSGVIKIDGQDIAKVTQDSLRDAMSLVPQDPILFHRSLMENIRYAQPSATDDQVIVAAKLAHAHEFITKFPLGYNTLVGERGLKLSGGERQRVAIARAILKDAPILVLDEATSSLDSESERFIQEALKSLMQNRTTIVVAHRLSTIMQMDRILVIEDGKIIEQGKHEELLRVNQGTYQKLWDIQAGGFASTV